MKKLSPVEYIKALEEGQIGTKKLQADIDDYKQNMLPHLCDKGSEIHDFFNDKDVLEFSQLMFRNYRTILDKNAKERISVFKTESGIVADLYLCYFFDEKEVEVTNEHIQGKLNEFKKQLCISQIGTIDVFESTTGFKYMIFSLNKIEVYKKMYGSEESEELKDDFLNRFLKNDENLISFSEFTFGKFDLPQGRPFISEIIYAEPNDFSSIFDAIVMVLNICAQFNDTCACCNDYSKHLENTKKRYANRLGKIDSPKILATLAIKKTFDGPVEFQEFTVESLRQAIDDGFVPKALEVLIEMKEICYKIYSDADSEGIPKEELDQLNEQLQIAITQRAQEIGENGIFIASSEDEITKEIIKKENESDQSYSPSLTFDSELLTNELENTQKDLNKDIVMDEGIEDIL